MHRFLDIVISSIALAILLPLFVPVIVILKLTGEGEVFFTQARVGRGGRMFGLLKFATMLKNSPAIGSGTVTVKDDPRILPFGKFLRKTKINELPQLFNILKGDMSCVGPRPQTQRCFDAFTPAQQEQIIRVRPGITGIGSIIFRDEENMVGPGDDQVAFYDQVIAPYKGELEAWYIRHQDLRTYFLICGLTAWVLAFPRTRAVWNVFPDLPVPPPPLQRIWELSPAN